MTSDSKNTSRINVLHADVRRLLKKYKCKYELHEVRAQFMGAIASPVASVSPAEEIKTLWNGEMPTMKSITAINELMQVFAMGLWNQLSSHTNPSTPFQLLPFVEEMNDKNLRDCAKIRLDELSSFLDAFYQGEESLKLDAEISKSLDFIEDMIGMFAGIVNIPKNKNETEKSTKALVTNIHELSRIAEIEINTVIVMSAQQRSQSKPEPPTLH